MDNPKTISDQTVLQEMGDRLSRWRIERNLTQAQLAQEAGISKRTLERLEAGHSTQTSNLIRVLRALDLLEGIEALIPRPDPNPLDLLRHGGQPRRRASSSDPQAPPPTPWTWGEER